MRGALGSNLSLPPVFSALLIALLSTVSGGSLLAQDRNIFEDQVANLRSPNVGTRVKAAEQLGKSGRKEAIAPLTEAVRDPEAKVREKAVEALRQFKDAEAVDGLLVGLEDEEKNIRQEALWGLLEIYVDPGSRGPLNVFLKLFTEGRESSTPHLEPFMTVDPRVVHGFEARLQDSEAAIRRNAAFALGVLKAEDGVDSLNLALSDPDAKVRGEAVVALGKIGNDAAGKALQVAVQDPNDDIRGKAIDSLGLMRYRPAARDLLSVYDISQGKAMGDRALAALSFMGAPEARGVFYQNLTSATDKRRRYAVEGLARLDDPNLLTGLTKDFLREPIEEVQLAYCFALARLGRPEFVDRLALSLPKPQYREQAKQYLIELGSPLMSELVTYLSDPVPEVRKAMTQVLMEIGDPAAIPYLQPLLEDPNREVADGANRAIARLQRVQMTASNATSG